MLAFTFLISSLCWSPHLTYKNLMYKKRSLICVTIQSIGYADAAIQK